MVRHSMPTDVNLASSRKSFKQSSKIIFSRNLEIWNKISLLIDAVLAT